MSVVVHAETFFVVEKGVRTKEERDPDVSKSECVQSRRAISIHNRKETRTPRPSLRERIEESVLLFRRQMKVLPEISLSVS